MSARLNKTANQLIKNILATGKQNWQDKTSKIADDIGLMKNYEYLKKPTLNKLLKKKTNIYFKRKVEKEGEHKSKVQHLLIGQGHNWSPKKRRPYMEKLTRRETSIIFQARTRMLKIKDNYRN